MVKHHERIFNLTGNSSCRGHRNARSPRAPQLLGRAKIDKLSSEPSRPDHLHDRTCASRHLRRPARGRSEMSSHATVCIGHPRRSRIRRTRSWRGQRPSSVSAARSPDRPITTIQGHLRHAGDRRAASVVHRDQLGFRRYGLCARASQTDACRAALSETCEGVRASCRVRHKRASRQSRSFSCS